jgi:hypothetical protein
MSAHPIRTIIANSGPAQPICVSEIAQLSSRGLDTCSPEDRCLAWLAMLGLYPRCACEWPEAMRRLHSAYWDLVHFSGLSRWEKRVIPADYPSEEFGLASDRVMAIVHMDIVRTGRSAFFLPPRPIPGSAPAADDDSLHFIQEHLRRLERALYVFSTLNVGLGYMQGFNELVAPLYYVLLKSMDTLFDGDIDVVESLTFHCLQELLTKTALHEFYTTQDKSSMILHRVREFEELMAKHLPDAARIVKRLKIHPLFYCLRWFTLLFAQEHDLPTLLMIWDSLWAHFGQFVEYLYCMALGHIHAVEGRLSMSNYGQTLSALQNLEITTDVKEVLLFANKCWDEDHRPQRTGFFAAVAAFTGFL